MMQTYESILNSYLQKQTIQKLRIICKNLNIKKYSDQIKPNIIDYLLQYIKSDEFIIILNNISISKFESETESILITDIINWKSESKREIRIKLLPRPVRNKTTINITDKYSREVLQKYYKIHYDYVIALKEIDIVNIRFPCIPEHISENIVKFLIHDKLNDKTCSWNCVGDLHSDIEKIQECKCFTVDAPLSFGPHCSWNVLYVLDATEWLLNKFKLYRINVTATSKVWLDIKVNNIDTFEVHAKNNRRPRIKWSSMQLQLKEYTEVIFDGYLCNGLIKCEVVEQLPEEVAVVHLEQPENHLEQYLEQPEDHLEQQPVKELLEQPEDHLEQQPENHLDQQPVKELLEQPEDYLEQELVDLTNLLFV
jgi:hypothetical protein